MADIEASTTRNLSKRQRLFNPQAYRPWIRADESRLPDCFLFWMPVSAFPARPLEKSWLREFLDRFSSVLDSQFGLRGEIFFQYKSVQSELVDPFMIYTQKCLTMTGIGRHADETLPAFPSAEQIREIVQSGKTFDVKEWVGDFLYWFLNKQGKRQRELFLGYGGMSTIFLPPDPKTKPPRIPVTPALRASLPVFQKLDVDGVFAATCAMQDQFLEKSKSLFGQGLESRPEYPGIAFILPLLDSAHFFVASSELRAKWFELFEVYVNESKKDKGILLAFQKPEYEPILVEVLESMRQDGLLYEQEKQWLPG